jgi:hypothetical protein
MWGIHMGISACWLQLSIEVEEVLLNALVLVIVGHRAAVNRELGA